MNVLIKIWRKPEAKVFLLAVLAYSTLVIFATGVNGGGDTFVHYQMSRYCWQHHHLLLNQWGKPVFTVLFSPIAQLGLQAVIWVNLSLIFFEAYLVFQIAKGLKMKRIWLAPFLFLTCPVVFDNAVSSLTEMICALFLILFIYWSIQKRFAIGSLIVSFMPFARSEGFVILGVVFLFFCFTQRWKYTPLLLTGSLVLNLLGYLQTGKVFWIFDDNPYVNTAITSYGSGNFFHFFIWALPVFGVGFLFVLYYSWKQLRKLWAPVTMDERGTPKKSYSYLLKEQIMFWLLLGSFWAYFMAHTMLWWLGMWASLGLTRVMFVVAAPMVILALHEINKYLDSIGDERKQRFTKGLIGICVFWALATNTLLLTAMRVPDAFGVAGVGAEEKVFEEACGWLNANGYSKKQTVYTGHIYVFVCLDIDPNDPKYYRSLKDYREAKAEDIIIWDGHYGPNEENTDLSKLESDSSLEYLHEFRPKIAFKTLNDLPFFIKVFRKK